MTSRSLLLHTVAFALLLLLPLEAAVAQDRFAITAVTVVDVADGSLRPDQTVLVIGDRIAAVGDTDAVEAPAGAVMIDGSGQYLIPGLRDMHVHLFNQISQRPPNLWYLPLLVANGVAGVREMWTKPRDADTLRSWREQIDAGGLLGPQIAAAGALVDGPGSWWATADVVPTDAEARRFVREVKSAGLDFVKVYSMLPPEAYFAIVEEAARVGLPVAGHIPLLVRAAEAAEAGQRSNEHLHQIREACSAAEATILAERRRLYNRAYTPAQDDSLWERHEAVRTDSYDSRRCAALAEHLAAASMWQVPTLVNERGYFLGPAEDAGHDPRLAYIPADERRIWREGLQEYTEVETTSQGRSAERLRRWKATLEVVRVLAEAGVPFMAGTDLGGPGIHPGFSLHEELELLVEAGLTPLQALQAATVNPARYLDAVDSLGTVEQGKIADLVLLEANPMEDISNTQRIAAVVLRGRYLDRDALDALLVEAERAADSTRQAVETVIRAYLDAFAAQDPELIRSLVTDDFIVIENGYPIALGRATEGMDPRRPVPMRYRVDDLHIEVDGDLAVYRFDLGWFANGEQVDRGLETGYARRIQGEWKLARNHMTFLPAHGDLPAARLSDFEGDYQGLDFQGREDLIRLYVDDGRLFMTRPSGRALVGGILRLEMLPDPAGGFFLEVLNGRVQFDRGADGEVSGLTYIPPPEQHPDFRLPLRYEKVP